MSTLDHLEQSLVRDYDALVAGDLAIEQALARGYVAGKAILAVRTKVVKAAVTGSRPVQLEQVG